MPVYTDFIETDEPSTGNSSSETTMVERTVRWGSVQDHGTLRLFSFILSRNGTSTRTITIRLYWNGVLQQTFSQSHSASVSRYYVIDGTINRSFLDMYILQGQVSGNLPDGSASITGLTRRIWMGKTSLGTEDGTLKITFQWSATPGTGMGAAHIRTAVELMHSSDELDLPKTSVIYTDSTTVSFQGASGAPQRTIALFEFPAGFFSTGDAVRIPLRTTRANQGGTTSTFRTLLNGTEWLAWPVIGFDFLSRYEFASYLFPGPSDTMWIVELETAIPTVGSADTGMSMRARRATSVDLAATLEWKRTWASVNTGNAGSRRYLAIERLKSG